MQGHHTPPPTTKTCYKCKQTLDVGMFHRDNGRKDGLQASCRACKAAMKRRWDEANREKVAAYGREYRRKRYAEDAEAIRERDRQRYRANREKFLERQRLYLEANRDQISARRRERRQANRDAVNERQRRYYEENKDSGSWIVRSRNRRDRIRANGGRVTLAEWQEILARFDKRCAKCGSPDNIHMDHVVPLAKGGRHSPDNVQPLCQTCNLQKHARTEDWRARHYRPLALDLDTDTQSQ